MNRLVALLLEEEDVPYASVRSLCEQCDSEGDTPLMYAIWKNYPLAVRKLIEAGVPINITPLGRTPLHTACYYGRSECIRLLLDAGANPNLENTLLQPPILSIPVVYPELKHLLLERGANWHTRLTSQFRPTWSYTKRKSLIALRNHLLNLDD
jgi:ankyrin repeat protein